MLSRNQGRGSALIERAVAARCTLRVLEILHFPPAISVPALLRGVSNCLLDVVHIRARGTSGHLIFSLAFQAARKNGLRSVAGSVGRL